MVNLFYDIIAVFSLIALFGWSFLSFYFFALCTMKNEISSNCRRIISNNYPFFYFLSLFCISYSYRFLLVVTDLKKKSGDYLNLENLLLSLDHPFFSYYRHIIVFLLLFLGICVVCHVINEMYNEIFDEYYFQLFWFSYIYYIQSFILFPIYIFNFINYFYVWLFYPSENKIESQDVLSRAIYFWFYSRVVFRVIAGFTFVWPFLLSLLVFFDNYFLIRYNESFESIVLRGLVRFVYGIYCVALVLLLMFFIIFIFLCCVLICISLKFCYLFAILIIMIISLIDTYIEFQEYRMRVFAGRSYWLS